MASLNINDELKHFAEEQATKRGLAGPAAYVEELLQDEKRKTSRENGHQQAAPVAEFFKKHTLEDLAQEQGVKPVEDFTQLLGNFWPEDESADDFIAAVRSEKRTAHRNR